MKHDSKRLSRANKVVEPERLAVWKIVDAYTQEYKTLLSLADPERSAVGQICDEHARGPKQRPEQKY